VKTPHAESSGREIIALLVQPLSKRSESLFLIRGIRDIRGSWFFTVFITPCRMRGGGDLLLCYLTSESEALHFRLVILSASHNTDTMMTFAFIQNIGLPELAIIFMFILIFFGAKRLPELFGSFGRSIKEFKKATRDIENDINTSMQDTPRQVNPPRQTVPNATETTTQKEPQS
jgi:sec-independent protein translocase protein TatA